jgi:transglutaminase-like putative cysteine protease
MGVMKLRVSHLTRYEYNQSVSFSPHKLYLRPRETALARLSRFSFNVSPHSKITAAQDVYDNAVFWAHFWDRSNALSIRSEFDVETLESNPFDFVLSPGAASYPFRYEAYERYMLTPYLALPEAETQELLRRWAANARPEFVGETVPLLTALNQSLYSRLRYSSGADGGIQDVVTTLNSGEGACRDLATALVLLLRTLGFAARFTSGYLFSDGDDTRRTPNAMHAWAEVYLPGAGWKGLDPSHGVFCTDAYIPVAHAPQGECIGAVQGSYFSTSPVPSQLTTRVLVERV